MTLQPHPATIVRVASAIPGVGRYAPEFIRLNFRQFPEPLYIRGKSIENFIDDFPSLIDRWMEVEIVVRKSGDAVWNEAIFHHFTQEPIFMTPTSEQAAIISAARGSSDLRVKALAGTGKTKTLELLTPELGLDDKPPSSVLALAFNVKIRDELKLRLPPRLPSGAEVKVQTLNGLGHGAWWSWTRSDLQVDGRKMSTIIREVTDLKGIRLSKDEFTDMQDLCSAAKAIGWVPAGQHHMPSTPIFRDDEEGIEAVFDWAEITHRPDLEVIFRLSMVESIKQAFRGSFDFNDQIYMPVVFRCPFKRYGTVLVDEAQDLSHLNHLMILASAQGGRLIVVGDENQAIYAFRGAMTNSFEALGLHRTFEDLPLTMTFRCAKAIVRRANDFVPDYTAAPDNPEGVVEDWTSVGHDGLSEGTWNQSSIPDHSAIICRNNAPLFKLAFKLLRQGRGCKMLGNDIGKSLEKGLNNATKKLPPSTPAAQVAEAVRIFFQKEITKAKTDRRKDSLSDRLECLLAIVAESTSLAMARLSCHKLFENPDAVVTLSSGHKSKGLEWETVIHLDPWRIPSQYAGTAEALRQEFNLRYVIETRAKNRLILANLEDFR